MLWSFFHYLQYFCMNNIVTILIQYPCGSPNSALNSSRTSYNLTKWDAFSGGRLCCLLFWILPFFKSNQNIQKKCLLKALANLIQSLEYWVLSEYCHLLIPISCSTPCTLFPAVERWRCCAFHSFYFVDFLLHFIRQATNTSNFAGTCH